MSIVWDLQKMAFLLPIKLGFSAFNTNLFLIKRGSQLLMYMVQLYCIVNLDHKGLSIVRKIGAVGHYSGKNSGSVDSLPAIYH